MLTTTTTTNHIVDAAAAVRIALCISGLGQTQAFDRVAALATRFAP